jgi:hypothetical protein
MRRSPGCRAICAYLAWCGLVAGDPDYGAELLDRFWGDIAASDPLERVVNDAAVATPRAQALLMPPEGMPYLCPFWGGNRLRAAVERQRRRLASCAVSGLFDAVRTHGGLFTEVKKRGEARSSACVHDVGPALR